ncbi:hypothetical protein K2173_006264 [Erythroxylum novogranatense]|uniref:GATA-type domain-containing protein n=1 Tax=Erythroxylum novogranatense TaxID=1862640 RepID=A0AAV8TEA2_9ROSI|nr:hypothetical protein K2173_006264 [Erythroxylum novogranatense]
MLYHRPHFFQYPSAPSSPLRFLSTSRQVQTEMECVEAALKTSVRKEKEMAMKSSPQGFFEDLWAVNVQNSTNSDDVFVDQLLDFSNEEGFFEEEGKSFTVSVSPKEEAPLNEKSGNLATNISAKDEFVPVLASELGVPADDLASLEWLSHFVEDSNSEYSTPFPAGIFPAKAENEDNPEPAKPLLTEQCFKTPIPAKARSKRTRTGAKVWFSGSPSLTTESSSSSTTSSSSSSSPSSPWLICTNPGSSPESVEPVCVETPPVKKYKKKPAFEFASAGSGAQQQPRRCSHCGVQKTPQWRAGPLGAKTLCNACGVRYKSGRLLPEYRPACSPTFSSELHSNHHRKVLEMRKKKEVVGQVKPGMPPPVLSSLDGL